MKSNRLGTAIAFVVAMLVGCGNCADDVRTLCDAPLRARPGAGAAEITVAFNQAYERVRSKKGKELVERIQGVERNGRQMARTGGGCRGGTEAIASERGQVIATLRAECQVRHL
jgi:hypothetical protein